MINEFDQNIITISDNICKNIASIPDGERGFVSQNILSNLRNLVEAIDQRIFSDVEPIELNCYADIEKAIKYVASRGNLRFLSKFHDYLQASVSHYTPDEDSSIRLMLKYYEWLLKIRDYCKTVFSLEILDNLEDYPLYQDESLKEYYDKIAYQLEVARYHDSKPNNRYYIQKSKPFFVEGKTYYQLTIISADDYSSKFNRFIVFSNRDIPSYYSIKLDFIDSSIDIIDRKMPVRIINNYVVAIRPVELEDIATILCINKVNTSTKEYKFMMDYLTKTGVSLTEIIDYDKKYYDQLKADLMSRCDSNNFITMLDKCRKLSTNQMTGHNIVRYLLLRLHHSIMKAQKQSTENNWISNLCLVNESLPFDNMPFDASLHDHNPPLFDLFSSINIKGHEDEMLSRRIRINTEQKVQLFTPLEDVKKYGDTEALVNRFNSRLIPKHKPTRSLVIENGQIYIKGYVSDTIWIINDLLTRKGSGLEGYKNSMSAWVDSNPAVDSEEKKKILPYIFSDANLALIYGAAGTGKTTLIKYLADFFANENKLFLANTNPAKEHLRREIKTKNSEFSTIAGSKQYLKYAYDVVFIDECSTVDNFAMKNLLEQLSCKLLVLVGDVFQIQSIAFGNWFGLARYFLPKNNLFELTTPYRVSQNSNLLGLWNRVRNLEPTITEYIYRNKYAARLEDGTIFTSDLKDRIILCLNYDGLYGINNINRFLQSDNHNPPVVWDSWVYKVDDPILFNENNRFYPVLYNNLKGWIRDIHKDDTSITFSVEVDMSINGFGASEAGFELLECDTPGHSIIRFSVNKYVDDDTRERNKDQVVPFQVAYAISIHKAQGLEYDSVKIVVTNEIEELISHNIFYTAITRAKRKLKIYWTPETQQKILSSIEPISNQRDARILEQQYGMKIVNMVKQIKRKS